MEAKQVEFAALKAVALEVEATSQMSIKQLVLDTQDLECQFTNKHGSQSSSTWFTLRNNWEIFHWDMTVAFTNVKADLC